MAEPLGENTKGKLLFCFGLQASCGGSKRVFFFSFVWLGHLERTRERKFSLQRVCGGPTKFYSLHLHGVPHVQKIRGFLFCF